MKETVKLGVVLMLFAAVACTGLAFVYAVTKPTIDGLDEKAFFEQVKSLFPDGEVDKARDAIEGLVSPDPKVTFLEAYAVKRNGNVLGAIVKVKGPSYGPDAVVLVGVALDRRIVGVGILTLNDSPGFGANAKDPKYYVDKKNKVTFPGQFKDKPVTDAFEVKKDVDSITASTITSRSIATMVKLASKAASDYLEARNEGVQ